jgi:Kef-type K+ transport system membrane component KefB
MHRNDPQVISHGAPTPLWQTLALVVGVIAGIFVIGRWLLPVALGYCASRRQMDALGLILFLAVIFAAWSVEQAGISMTLGAFLLSMACVGSAARERDRLLTASAVFFRTFRWVTRQLNSSSV